MYQSRHASIRHESLLRTTHLLAGLSTEPVVEFLSGYWLASWKGPGPLPRKIGLGCLSENCLFEPRPRERRSAYITLCHSIMCYTIQVIVYQLIYNNIHVSISSIISIISFMSQRRVDTRERKSDAPEGCSVARTSQNMCVRVCIYIYIYTHMCICTYVQAGPA